MNPFETDLDKNAANYVPLSPLGFLARSAAVYPKRLAVVPGERRYYLAGIDLRSRPLSRARGLRCIRYRDTVADIVAHLAALFVAQFHVPLSGPLRHACYTR